VERKLVSKYGIVDIVPDKHADRMHKVQGLVEKPQPDDAPSTLGIIGKYLVPRSTIAELEKVESSHLDKEIRLIDALKAQLKAKKIDIYGYEIEGQRFDTGTPAGYRDAVAALG
jgi:UTP--glucose-1-phosphate uridylyltransferase